MFPTIADIVDLPSVRQGRPRVVAGVKGMGHRVRWTHVAELPDIAHLLRGGELLLSTGVALPDSPAELNTFVVELAAVDIAGIAVELGRRYQDELPAALVNACEEHGVPLIELRRETPFVQVTESVHALIVDAQLSELRMSEQVHQTFNELSVEGAQPTEVVRQTARMAQAPVVLENLSHQVLAFDTAGTSHEELLDRWEARSRLVAVASRTGHDRRQGWLVSTVGARGTDWGRLIVCLDRTPSPRDVMLIERSAATLALNRLVERDRESLERQTHRTLLAAILSHEITAADGELRAQALGVPLLDRTLVGVVLRHRSAPAPPLEAQAQVRTLADSAAGALRGLRAMGLIGVIDNETVGVLLSLSGAASVDAILGQFSQRVRQQDREASPVGPELMIAVGSPVTNTLDARRSFDEAHQVANAATGQPARDFFRLPDVRIRGLVQLLKDDSRLQSFIERELGPLLALDPESTELLTVLRHYLDAGRNASAAAHACHLSRPSLYARLRRIEDSLGADLGDVETCVSLHVAIIGLEAVRADTDGGPPGR